MKKLAGLMISSMIIANGIIADDHGNTLSSATNIGSNSSISGSIERSGDIDVFRLNASRSGRISIYTTGSMDTYGYLINSNRQLVSQNDDSGENTNFRINASISPGTYYIVVKGYGSSTGNYTLYTRFENGGNNPVEPNIRDDHGNSFSSATRININSSINGNLERGGDYDFFRFRVPANGTVTVYTTGSTDTYGSLIDGNMGLLQSDDDSGQDTNFRIVKRVSAGTYYVRVRGYNNSTTGRYRLYVSYNQSSNPTTATLRFPVSGRGWSNTSGSPYHRLINYAGRTFDDTNALDLNLNTPSYNSDRGRSVGAVASGRVVVKYPSLGFILLRHDTPLRLDNGRVYNVWYSGYMHMRNLTDRTYISAGDTLGRISRVGATNDHLHFAIYIYSNGVYRSINVRRYLSSFARNISYWY